MCGIVNEGGWSNTGKSWSRNGPAAGLDNPSGLSGDGLSRHKLDRLNIGPLIYLSHIAETIVDLHTIVRPPYTPTTGNVTNTDTMFSNALEQREYGKLDVKVSILFLADLL